MAERVDKIIGHSSLAKPTLSTFHSFCVRVLRRDIEALQVNGKGLTRTFAIYDETDQQAVVKTALKRLGIDDKSSEAARGARPHLLGEEPHDRPAGVLPRQHQSARREDRPHLRDLQEGAA